MRIPLRIPQRFHPLVMALLAAMALHALLLSYVQLKRSKTAPTQPLRSRDNTPELLQFSSQPAPLTTLDVLPFQKASNLPPPPPHDLLSPLRPSPKLPSQQRLRTGPRAKVSRAAKLLIPKRLSSVGSGTRPSDRLSSERQDGWDVTLQQFRTFRQPSGPSAANLPGEPPDDPLERGEGPLNVLTDLDAAQQMGYQRLWSLARPSLSTPKLKPPGDPGDPAIEIRSLPLNDQLDSNLEIRHRLIVVLQEKAYLFWLDDQKNLWILQAKRDLPPD